MKRFLTILMGSGLFAGALLLGCFSDKPNAPAATGVAEVQLTVGDVGTLGKLNRFGAIQLQSLLLQVQAEGEAPSRDTLAITGTGSTVVNRSYALSAGKTWTLFAQSRDQRDSIIHAGSVTFTVEANETLQVTLDLNAVYSMMEATFSNLPDSITRCAVIIDSVVVDTIVSAAANMAKIAYDYLASDSQHNIGLRVYGVNGGAETLLYTADTSLMVVHGQNQAISMLLARMNNSSYVLVTLGAVGMLNVEGVFPEQAFKKPCRASWSFDEGSGGRAFDSSESANHLVAANGSLWGTGIRGACISAGNDAAGLVSLQNMAFDTNNFSIGLWYKREANTNQDGTILVYNGPGGWSGTGMPAFRLMDLSGRLTVTTHTSVNTDNRIGTSTVASDLLWHYLVLVRDGREIRFYIDGSLHARDSASEVLDFANSEGRIHVAANGFYEREALNGSVDEVQIVDSVLSSSAILLRYQEYASFNSLLSDTLAYWRFDEGSGDTARDTGPMGNHLFAANSSMWGTGITGTAASNSTNTTGFTSLQNVPFGTTDFSVSLWYKRKANTNQNGTILVFNGPGTSGYPFFRIVDWLGVVKAQMRTSSGSPDFWIGSSTVSSDLGWHQFAFKREGKYAQFFVDGVLQATDSSAQVLDLTNPAGKIHLGANGFYSNDALNGYVDEVLILKE